MVAAVGNTLPIGRLSRIAVGTGLLAAGMLYAASGRSVWWQLALGFAGFPALVILLQIASLSLTGTALRLTGPLATCLNCAIIIVLLLAWPTRNAMLIFLGMSLLVAAGRGYRGCESLALSNWLLGRDDQVGCLIFSPIDALDSRLGSAS